MKRIMHRNKNGEGRSCKNRVCVYLDDAQYKFLNKLSNDFKMSKTDIFRLLLYKEYDKRCLKLVVNCEKNNEKIPNWDEIKW